MIIWPKNIPYKKHKTETERIQFLQEIITADTLLMIKVLNTILNILVPVLIFWLSNRNVWALAIGFILMDSILAIVEQVFFIEIPYRKMKSMNLQDVQKRLNKLTEISQKLHQTKIPMLTEKAKHSDFYNGLLKMAKDKAEKIDEFIKADSRYVEAELNKLREVEMKETKTSKNYEKWTEYFVETNERLSYFANTHNFKMLCPVIEAIDSLLNILRMKPYGESKINHVLKVYLDELNVVLGKIVTLSNEQDKTAYMDKLQEVSTALTSEIKETILVIDEIDKKDISSTLTTLLDELNRAENATS